MIAPRDWPTVRRISHRPAIATAVLTGVLACLVALALLLAGGRGQARLENGVPHFVAHELGGPRSATPSTSTPTFGARLIRNGFTAGAGAASFDLTTAGTGTWTRYARGAVRRTPYGREAIVLGPGWAEQLTTVDRHLGAHTWRWRLGNLTLKPRLIHDGGIAFGSSTLQIAPAKLLDVAGRDITPTGSRWSLRRAGGSWWLELKLDDARLPVPYVIDPFGFSAWSADRLTAGATATYTATFKSGSNLSAVAGDGITITWAAGYTVPATETATPISGFSANCALSATSVGQVTTIALVDSGGSCTLSKNTNATFTIGKVTNPTTTGVKTSTLTTTQDGAGGTASVTIATATGVSAPTYSATTMAAGALADWTATTTTSASGSLAAGDTITLLWPGAFTLPSPLASAITIGGTGATNCSAASATSSGGGGADWTIVITLADNGGPCAVSSSGQLKVTLTGMTNPAQATYTTTHWAISTSGDFTAKNPTTNIATAAKTVVTGLSASGSPQTAGARSTWTIGFTTSTTVATAPNTSGALNTGDLVKVTFPTGFSVPASPTVTLTSGFGTCTVASATTSGQVVTITLGGATCSVAASTAVTLKIATPTNTVTAGAAQFSIATSVDTATTGTVSPTIAAATPVTSLAFSGSPQTAGSTANWTVNFTTSGSGALSAGDSLAVTFPSGFTVPASPTVSLGAAFGGSCVGTGSTSGQTVTIALSGTCTVANSTATSIQINGLTNPSQGNYAAASWSMTTTRDTAAANPAGPIPVRGAPTSISFSPASLVYGASSNWTVGFTSTSTGSLATGNTVTVTLPAAFTVPASPTVTLTGFTGTCSSPVASSASSIVTITLPAGCSLAASTSASVGIQGITNGVPATYGASSFALHTTGDPLDGNPAAGITIGQKPLTVTGLSAQSKTYDGTTAATLTGTPALNGIVGSDVVTIGGSPTATFSDKTVGNAKTVTVSGYTLGGANASNYTLTQPTPSANITAKTLTVTGIGIANKTYDRTTAATITGTASLSGVVAGDTVTLGGSPSATFADKNVGTGKAVTVSGYSISGADAGNYSLSQPSALTANITAAALTVTGVSAANKIYDRTTTATLSGTPSLNGVVAGDTVTLGGSPSATFADKNVGTGKTVTVAGYTISGADAANYTLSQPSLTANITPAALTITGATASSKTYDGTTAATINVGSALLGGVISPDSVTLTVGGASATFADKNVGASKTVSFAGFTISGADAGNYTLSQPTTTASITAKALAVTGITASSKVYDRTTAATIDTSAAALGAGVVGGDSVSLVKTGATGSFADKNVGTAKTVTITGLSLSGTDAGNYTVTQPTTTANITAKALTVSGVSAQNKTYDGTTSATLAAAGASLNGVIAGDTVGIDLSSANGTFASKHVGTGIAVTVVGIGAAGTDAGNYTVTQPATSANITAKNLTISNAVGNAKVYDATTAATVDFSGATLNGVVGADSVSVDASSATFTFASKNVGPGVAITASGVGLAGTSAGDYTVSQPTGLTANITAATLTVNNVTAQSKVYDGNTNAALNKGSAALAGVQGTDAVTLDGTGASGAFASKTVAGNKPVTVTGFALAGADAGNYTLSQPTGLTASITAKPLTATGITATSRVYDGTTTATLDTTSAAIQAGGVVAGDTVSLVTTGAIGAFASKTVGTGKTVTVSGLGLSGTDAGNYTIGATTTADITAKALTVTGITASNKQYDRTTAATIDTTSAALQAGGVVAGDTVGLVTTGATGTFGSKDVGTRTVTISGLGLNGADAADYTITSPTTTATITAKPLTVDNVTAQSRAYDGTTSAALNTGTAALNGVIGGDTVTLDTSAATGTFASKNVGTGIAVSVGGMTIAGADAADYSVTQPTTSASVTPRNLTISGAVGNTKAYDGTTTATVDFTNATLNTLVAGDSVSIDAGSATFAFASSGVGTGIAITASNVGLTGTDAADYTVSQPTGLTANITRATLTVTGVTANGKQYDRTTAATLNTGGATLVGVASGDTVSLDTTSASGTFDSSNVGAGRTVTVSGLALTGADAGNYTLTQPTTTAAITAKPLSVTGVTAGDKTYDGTTSAVVNGAAAQLQGVISPDDVTLDTTSIGGAFTTKAAGASKTVQIAGLALVGADKANYNLVQPTTTAAITPAPLTVTGITADGKVYDATTTATVHAGSAVLHGVVAGDDATLDATSVSGAFATKDVGTINVQISGLTLSGADAADYSLIQPTTTATITKASLTVNGLTAQSKVYDRTTGATVGGTPALVGVLGSDQVVVDVSGAQGTFDNRNVGTGHVVSVAGVSIAGTDAGNYALTQPTLSANITALNLTISGAVGTDKVYDATTGATVDFSGATLPGVISGDSVSIDASLASATFADKNVGTGKPISVSGVALQGTDAGNYTVSQPSGLTADITAAPLTVTGVVAQTKSYDGTIAATLGGTAVLSGKLGSDDVTLGGTPTATFASKDVGTRVVAVTGYTVGGSDAGNYSFTQPSGLSAAITAKTLTVTGITASSKVYDGSTAATIDVSGAQLNGVAGLDAVDLVTGGATGAFADKTVGSAKTVQIAGLALGGADAGDYTVTQPTTTADITARALTVGGVTADDKTYDGTTAATLVTSGAALVNVVAGDDVTLGGTPAGTFADKNAAPAKTVTVAGYTIGGLDAGNYTLTQPTATAAILKKNLTLIGAQANNKAYDGTATATVDFSSASLSGIVGSENVTFDTTGYAASFASASAGSGIAVTVTGVALGGTDAGNYMLSQPSGLTADITGRPLTITGVAANDKVYDGTTAATLDTASAQLSGVVAGDDVTLVKTGATGSFATPAAAANKAVTVGGFTITGADAPAYQLAQPTGITATISPKALTVTGVTAADKTYDSTTAATVDASGASLAGKVGSDDVSLGGTATGTFADDHVGAAKTVTVAGLTLSGADAGDYTVTQPTTTAAITPKALTVSGVTAQDKIYDGTTSATLDTTGAQLVGVVSGDTVVLGGSATGRFATKTAGTGKPVTVTGFTLSGANAGDYALTQPTPTASIDAKTITVTGIGAANKVYDHTTAATLTFSSPALAGVVSGDTVSLSTVGAGGVFGDKDVGTGKTVTVSGVSIGGADAGDYVLVEPSPLADITPATLTLTGVTAADKVYDGNASASLSGSPSLQGVYSGDTVTVSGTASGTFGDARAGASKTVTIGGLSLGGTDAADYSLTQPTTTAAITPKALTITGVSATDKIYDGTVSAPLATGSASLSGAVAGDDVSLVAGTGTLADRHVGTAKAVTASGFGLAGADASDYTVAQPTGLTASIVARPITVTAQPDTKTYDATTSSGVLPQVTSGSLATGDTASFTQAFATATVGSNKTLVPSGSVNDGNGGNDYAVTFADGTGTITPAAASKLAFTQAPPAASGGVPFSTQPEVSIEDTYGNVVTTDNTTHVTLSIDTNPSGGTLTCPTSTLTVRAVNGVATFAGCTINKRGTGYTLTTANDDNLVQATTSPFDVVVGTASAAGSTASGPATVVADGITTGTITVTLLDGGDNPVPGKTVSLTQGASTHATISGNAVTDASGHATLTVADQTAEVVTFTATDVDDSVTVAQTAAVSFEDHNPPSVTIGAPNDGVDAAGTVALTATGVADGETGVQGVTFQVCHGTCSTLAGVDQSGGVSTASLDTTTLTTGQSYTWSATAIDKAGNTATTGTRTFLVDNSTPTISWVAPSSLTGPAYYDGAASTPTIWLNPVGSGSFTLNASAADAESGIAKVHFPALLGTAAADDTASPYTGTYAFDNQGSDVTGNAIVATNGVTAGDGANTSSTSFDVKVDGAGPSTTMDAALNGKTVSTGVLVGATSTDAGSGVAQVSFLYCDRTTTPLCAPSIAIGSSSSATLGEYSVTWTTTGLTDGDQYAVAAVSTDNVGNETTSPVVTVTVDNSAPAIAFQAPTTTGDTYFDGTKLYVNAAGGGSYTLHAHATDATSGISSVVFGTDTGTASGGGNYDSPSYSNDGTGATLTVTASNGVQLPAALTSNDQLQRVADGAAPTTGVQFPVDGGGYDLNSWQTGSQACSGTAPEGLCGTVSDTGSGVANVKLTLEDLGGGTYFDGTGFSAGVTTLSVTPSGNDWSYPLVHSKLGTGTYELKVYATDNVGNVETTQTIDFQYGTDLTPPDTQLTLSSATHAYLTQVGSHVSPNAGNDYDLFYSTAGNGDFTLHAVSTDVSGIDHIAFPSVFGTSAQTQTNGSAANPWTIDSNQYTFGSGDTTPPAQANVVSVDTAIPTNNSGNDTITFLVDNAAPTGGSIGVGPVDTNDYATTTSLNVSHVDYADAVTGSGLASSVLTVASSALSDGTCGVFGSDAPASDGAFTATNGTCYRFTLTGTDNVGNVATTTQVVKVDATAPSAPSVVFGGLTAGNTYDDGAGTLWYRPTSGAGFTVTASATDAESGIEPGNAGYVYSSGLGGTQTGGQIVVTDTSGLGSGAYTVKAANRAALQSSAQSFAVDADAVAPVNGALKVNGTDATGVGTSSYLTSGSSVTIDARTDYTDADSGIQSSILTMETGTLAHDVCTAYGAAQTISGTPAQSVSNGHCYRFVLTGTDNVGNTATVTTIVEVDTTPPTTTGVAFSGLSAGNAYDNGAGTLWYRPSAGGTFTATLTGAADPETDIAGYTFSPLAGFASTAQSGNALTVDFNGASTGGGSYSAVATNHANVDSAPAPFTVTADTTAPTGGLLSINPYSSSLSVSIGETDFADAGSGIATNVLTRSNAQAPSAGTCPGTGYTGATTVALSGGAATDTVPSDGACYEYTLTGTDHVGNTATYTTIVLVDTTPPTGGSASTPDGLTSLSKIPVDWNAGSDAESGIATVDIWRATATLSGSTCGSFGSYTRIASNVGTSPYVDSNSISAGNCYEYEIVVTNRAGVSATFTAATVTKLTNASPITLAGNPAGTYLSGSTLWVGPSADATAGVGLQLTGLGQNGITSADWSAGTGTLTGTATTANAAPFASGAYTWTGTPGGTIDVTRQPTGTVDTLTVSADTTPPTGSITQPNGINPSHSVPVTTSGVGDGESGLAGTEIDRAETTLTGGTCGTTWSAFAPVTLVANKDLTVQDDHCYQYRLIVTDNVGNQHVNTSTNVVEIPDITPPTFSSATTDASGTQLTITMSEPLDASSTPGASQFTVYYNGVAQPAPTSVSISGSDVVLGLASPPNNSQTVTVRYSSDGSLRDQAVPTENSAASFGQVAVTNTTPDTVAPSFTSADVDGTTLTVHFDEALAGAAPGTGAFAVTVHGDPRAIAAVATSGSTVTLTLSAGVNANDSVVVGYAVPALNALHDAAGNQVAAFTSSVTNNTPAASAAPPTTTTTTTSPIGSGPFVISTSPADGATVTSVTSFTLTADRPVTWTHMTLTRPNGTVTGLADGSGATATYSAGTTDQGLYVVRGTIADGGASAEILTHFTVWQAPSSGSATAVPPVEKNAAGTDSVVAGDGSAAASWTPTTFGGEPVVIELVPKDPASISLPAGSIAVDVTAFMRDSHTPVKQLGDVLDVQFPHAPTDAQPEQSQDAKTWSDVAALPTLQLPAGQSEGWFRDSDGTVHVLTRHLTYFALVVQQAQTKLALQLTTPRRLWLAGRDFMAVRIVVTAPARVTGSFVAPDGTVIPGQVIRTPTRHAGATILRVPLHVRKPGVYRLQVHAEGIGQVADRTARIRFVEHRPPSPVWQASGPLSVAVIRGLRLGATTLGAALGPHYVVHTVQDADLYTAVDPNDPRAAAAVVVDLATVPLPSLASLHALLPELRIIGLTSSRATAAAARKIGVDAVVVKHTRAPAVTHMIEGLIPRR